MFLALFSSWLVMLFKVGTEPHWTASHFSLGNCGLSTIKVRPHVARGRRPQPTGHRPQATAHRLLYSFSVEEGAGGWRRNSQHAPDHRLAWLSWNLEAHHTPAFPLPAQAGACYSPFCLVKLHLSKAGVGSFNQLLFLNRILLACVR